MRFLPFLLGLALLASRVGAAELPQRIFFGSCSHQNRAQPIWESVVEKNPELFLFLGDKIYGDTTDIFLLREKYVRLGAQPGFQKLVSTCRVLGTWDDHDYGVNDGGVEFRAKRESQEAFLDFFGVPENSPRRKQEGVYNATVLEGSGRRVQIILLDTRYFRSPLIIVDPPEGKKKRYIAPNTDPEATILGEAQWRWLEEQLRQPADLRIIGSSIQVLPEDHRFEKWANFPRERERLFRLIAETRAAGVIFISGDRHMAEISRVDGPGGYPLYDVTSSGLTHAGGGAPGETNRHRVSETNFRELNFGGIEVDWSQPDPLVQLRVFGLGGEVVQEQQVRLSELQPR